MPATQKMKLKGGAAVDPDSELEDRAHVLQEKGDIYNVVLGLVDVVKGMNSYYKLQILEADSSSRWSALVLLIPTLLSLVEWLFCFSKSLLFVSNS